MVNDATAGGQEQAHRYVKEPRQGESGVTGWMIRDTLTGWIVCDGHRPMVLLYERAADMISGDWNWCNLHKMSKVDEFPGLDRSKARTDQADLIEAHQRCPACMVRSLELDGVGPDRPDMAFWRALLPKEKNDG